MKALRKCVLVAVQLVITTALVFQRCPVLAFAASEQAQSDNEAAASAADQGDEAAAQCTDPVEASASVDSSSAAQAIAGAETSSVPKPSNPGEWKTVGSCLWMIDETGLMTIKPEGDGVGCIDDTEYRCPWSEDKDSISGIVFKGDIELKQYYFTSIGYFSGLSNLKSVDLGSIHIDESFSVDRFFYNCNSLTSIKVGQGVSFNQADWGDRNVRWRSSVDGVVYQLGHFPSGVAATYTRDDSVVTGSWYQVGTCKWMVDKNGQLTIKPLNGSSGSFGTRDGFRDQYCPWSSFKDQITSVVFQGHIAIKECMDDMFHDYKHLRSIDFGSIDTSAVSSMSGLFAGCSSLTAVDLSTFDTRTINSYGFSLFEGCSSLTKITFGKLVTFSDSNARILIDLPDNSKTGRWVSSADGVAYENDGVPLGVAATYTPQTPDSIKGSWNQCGSCLWKLDDSGTLNIKPQHGNKGVLSNGFAGYSQNSDTYAWLRLRNQIKKVKIADGVSTGADASYLFNGCSNLISINIEALDTSNATDMSYMFQGCSSLGSLDLSKFDTSKVERMFWMFKDCRALKSLDLSSFDTSKVSWMSGMFYDCDSLRTVDVTSFDTSNVSEMNSMFSGCSSLVSVDLSSFDTSSVTNAYGVFCNCSSLKRLDLSSFDMSAAREMNSFFYGCTSLQEVNFGDSFVFVGTDSFLPSQYSWDVPITWQNSEGRVLSAKDIPSFTADTYRAVVGSMPRLAGGTRYETAGLLFDQGNWQQGGSIVLASGANYPDALAASALAGDLNAPIMLTDPNGLSTETEWRIQNLKPARVYIIGGNAAVSTKVERRIAQLIGSESNIQRIAGDTRYDTSLKVASSLSSPSDTVIVTTGTNYADALSISPYAFATGSPVVLSSPSSGLSDSALKAIKKAGYKKAVIVGGASAVPASVASQLKAQGIGDITRLSGDTRYATSAKIAEFELKQNVGFTMDGAYLATGQNFPDALAAGALSGKHLAPLLLVDPGAHEACSFLSKYKGEVSRVIFVGGTSAIGNAEAISITRALGVNGA